MLVAVVRRKFLAHPGEGEAEGLEILLDCGIVRGVSGCGIGRYRDEGAFGQICLRTLRLNETARGISVYQK